MKDIMKLVNENKWDTILHLIKKNKLNPIEIVINNNSIAHLAAVNNNNKILLYLSKNHPKSLKQVDEYGNTPLHLLLTYGYNDLFKNCLENNKQLASIIDMQNNTFLHLLEDSSIVKWVLDNCKDMIDINMINHDGYTILNVNIEKMNNINNMQNNFYTNIKNILKCKPNLNIPTQNLPLIQAINSRNNLIIDMLLSKKQQNNIDINLADTSYTTPFMATIINKMYDVTRKLVTLGADVNKYTVKADDNVLNILILRGDNSMVEYMLKHKYNPNSYDMYMNTPLHIALMVNKQLSNTLLFKLIYYMDLNIQNINGDTGLHLLIHRYKWDQFNIILTQKKLDIFIKNSNNETPLTYVPNDQLADFIELVANSYINNMNNKYKDTICDNNTKSQKCLQIIKTYIFKNNKSYPDINDESIINKQFKMIKGSHSFKGNFNSDAIHNIIYTICLLERNTNLGIPFQNYNYDKVINDMSELINNNVYRGAIESIIPDVVNLYYNIFYDITPYLILWCSSTQYFVHKDLEYYLQKCFLSTNIRFIFIKLTLIPSSKGTHANIIIFDKHTGIMERFEPYGVVPYVDADKLDYMLEFKLGSYYTKYLKTINKKLTYLKPADFMNGLSFQTFSDDSNIVVKKLGDPVGYCLAWTFWYLELRVNNPDIHPKDIIKNSISSIINKSKVNEEYKFIDFIRNYATELDNIKNRFLLDAGILQNNIYNYVQTDEDLTKLKNHIKIRFQNIITRY
jgi:ankyrin repeat protein